METISDIGNDVTCPGVIINMIITVIILIVGTLFGVNAIKNSVDGGMKLKIIVVMIGLYLFWLLWGTFWHRVSSRLCENSLYSDSVFVSLSPVIFVLVISFTILFILGMLELVNLLIGKKWGDIILLTEFKEKIDGTKLTLKDSTIGESIIDKGRKMEKQADNLKETIVETENIYKDTNDIGTKKLLDSYIKQEKKIRDESKVELNKGRIYSDKYFGRIYRIKNLRDNPYGLMLIGEDSNDHVLCEVIIEHRLKNGWSGILKIMKLDKDRPYIKYLDKSKYSSLFKNDINIKTEIYGKIKLITKDFENIVIIENNKENETYIPEGKGIGTKVLHGSIILFIVLFVVGIGLGLISGEYLNIFDMYSSFEERIKRSFEVDDE